MDPACPECGVPYNTTSNRLVKETCGHDKCRRCLLATESGCIQCFDNTVGEIVEERCGTVEIYEIKTGCQDTTEVEESPNNQPVFWEEEEEPEHEDVLVDDGVDRGGSTEEDHEQDMDVVHYEEVPVYEVEEEREDVDVVEEQSETDLKLPITIINRTTRKRTTKNQNETVAPKVRSTPVIQKSLVVRSSNKRRKTVFSEDNMPAHLQKKICGEKIKFACSMCNKEVNRNAFTYHIYCDPSIPMPFPCKLCDKSFRTADHHRYHLTTHSNSYIFQCDNCDKTFRNKITLAAHVRQTHSGIPAPFKCDVCEKTFFSASKYKLHLDMHNDVLSHECPVCPRRFRLKENMLKHQVTHTEAKPFHCAECNIFFKRAGSYKKHLQRSHDTNSSVKLMECKECSKGFRHATLLKRHESEHTGSVMEYQCLDCSVSCTRRDNLLRHIRMMHFDGDATRMSKNPLDHMQVKKRQRTWDGESEEIGEVYEEEIVDEVVIEAEEEEVIETTAEDQTARKSSVIIYVGPQGRSGGAVKPSPAKVRVTKPSGSSGSSSSRPEMEKKSRPLKEDVDDFSTMSSDKMEIYRKILMPSRDCFEIKEDHKEEGDGDGEKVHWRKRTRSRINE